jgi:hypothetical protein
MAKSFKAFLSCSFLPEDRPVVDFFQRLIKSFDFEPVIYDYQEPGRIPERVKQHIGECECLIALATRREKTKGSGEWSYPAWVHDEILLAHDLNKPIAIFVEEGVSIEGLIKTEERREGFCRDRFLEGVDKITKFLFKLRSDVQDAYQREKEPLPILYRHYMRVRERLPVITESVDRVEVLMECLAEELEATFHSTELEETTPGLSIRPKQFDFVCKEKPADVKVEAVTQVDTDRKHLWKATFDRPLRKGEKVLYAFKMVRSNDRPLSYEQLEERIRLGTYDSKTPLCVACDWTMLYPTGEFSFEIEFPDGYELSDCRVDVKMGEAHLKADAEVKRIKDGRMFSADKLIDSWTLRLRVPNPLPDHTYYIYYLPPHS